MSPPLVVTPEAAFIAASAASQIVTNDHDSHSETWYDQFGIEPSDETALVSHGALQLANNFVDQLLFNFLGVARSTSLSALRPAVSEVLKPKLAKDAINQADEELREYLGGGEVEDLEQSPTAESSPRDWDLELVWKRTRLRCMVYSSLGDMEEEDEDYYMEQENLEGGPGNMMNEAVSPAVAIFLTSILEFMGEQVLVISGQAAFNRLRTKYEKELKDGTRSPGAVSERIVVEELDVERVALDRTLGRLWRSWKKKIRSPIEPSRPFFNRSANHSRRGSICADPLLEQPTHVEPSSEFNEFGERKEDVEGAKDAQTEEIRPSAIPLPMSNNDIAEIEVPGLVSYSDDESSDEEEEEDLVIERRRPKSLIMFPPGWRRRNDAPTPNLSQPHTPLQASRKRANSLPTPAASPYSVSKPSSDAQSPEAKEEQTIAMAPAEETFPEAVEVSEKEEKVTTKEEKDAIATVSTGAVAAGLAAVGGVTTEQRGSLPLNKKGPAPVSPAEDDMDEFTGEAQIMTSSRICISGRSSPGTSESGRPLSIIPVRSNSVRSLRVIDVQPRSPSVRSRPGSIDMPDYISASRSNYSREGSISTPPIMEEGDAEAQFATALKKNNTLATPSPPLSRDPSPASSTKLAPPSSGPTKVTILSHSTSFLDLDSQPEPVPVPQPKPETRRPEVQRPEVQQRPEPLHKSSSYPRQPPLPTLPEKSASRYGHGQSSSAAPPVDRVQSARRGSPDSAKITRAVPGDSPSSLASLKLKSIRNSDESGSNRAEDVARNFEELLNNDQTIQYTLTPENMRDIDSQSVRSLHNGGSPVAAAKSRKNEDSKQAAERAPSASIKRSLSVSRSTGLNSHPPELQTNGNKLAGPVPRAPPVSMLTQTRSAASAQARDARVPRESINDFADFIRTTGPSGGVVDRAPMHHRDISAPVTSSAARSSMVSRQASVNRMRLQARDPVINTSNESSDLIDFIRRGPPSSGNNPRIPRNVAPFRSTMDSDLMQMSGAVGGKAVDAVIPDVRNSQASTQFTETSVQSSVNSQSALLSKTHKPMAYTNFDDDDMTPKRKQRRVRDPYAIDFSDEEDDDFGIATRPKPKQTHEESLIDFLNNYQPPPDPTPPQPFITSQNPPKKKASAPNLMARLRSAGGGSSSSTSRNGFNNVASRSLSSRASNGRGYTPIVANIPPGAEKFINTVSSTPRQNSINRVPMKKFEPREAVSSNTRTNDLAMFLRDSEPPSSAMAGIPSQTAQDKNSGFSRMFERRKKSIY